MPDYSVSNADLIVPAAELSEQISHPPGADASQHSVLVAGGDCFMVLADYPAFVTCPERVDAVYRDPADWDRRAILNVAGMGRFSSDRTAMEYATRIWGVQPVRR